MQLMSYAIPEFKSMLEEGESGRKRISQYTRYLTVLLAIIQAVVITIGFKGFLLVQCIVSILFYLLYRWFGCRCLFSYVCW